MNQDKTDYSKDCKTPLGAYVKALNEPKKTNSQASRIIDSIYPNGEL